MLIDVTSFTKGPRHIENASDTPSNANHIAVTQCIEGYIEYYQPIFLKKAVGDEWADKFDAYSRVDHVQATEEGGEDETPAEPTEEETTIASLIDYLKEPFANFVFFYMLRDMNRQATITGYVQLKCANNYMSTLDKGTAIWNDMVDKMNDFVKEAYEQKVSDINVDEELLTVINQFNL